jgi:hypothetical protein
VLFFNPEFNDHPEQPLLPSIGELVHLWLEAFQDGTYRIVDGAFEVDLPDVLQAKWKAKGRAELIPLL